MASNEWAKIGQHVIADEDIVVGHNRVAARQNEEGVITAHALADHVEVKWVRTGVMTVTHARQITLLAPEPRHLLRTTATNHAFLDSMLLFIAELRKLNEDELETVREELKQADSLLDDAYDATKGDL